MAKRKRKKARSAQVFKPYHQHQALCLPPSLEEMIPANHVVRVVNKIIDALDIGILIMTYQGSGTSAYQPIMLLKVLVYAYISKVYSSRRIAKALREDVNFMWLAGMSRPDFHTINGFRSGRLKPVIDQVFGSTVTFLIDNKYVDLQSYFVDGTKLQADNNRHKVVWSKNTKRYKTKYQEKIAQQLAYIEEINQEENTRYGKRDLEELGEETHLTSEEIRKHIEQLNEALKREQRTSEKTSCEETLQEKIIPEKTPLKKTSSEEISHEKNTHEATLQEETSRKETPSPKGASTTKKSQREKQRTKAIKEIEKNLLPKLEKYEQQERILQGRNSYAKTDHDATVFRMKDGQLLPAYNVLVGTQNQFILNYSMYQRKASEADALIAHLKRFKALLGYYPPLVMGDSAFGSEENYAFLSSEGIDNYLKYNTFHRDFQKKYRDDPYRKENFSYDEHTDTYHCPQGRRLEFHDDRTVKTTNGYLTSLKIYQCVDCSGCPVAEVCKRGAGNRTIQINEKLETYRAEARANLTSKRGIALRKRRGVDVEPTFGDIKFNQGYVRCRLRGEEKVNVELGLLSIAHNSKKVALMKN